MNCCAACPGAISRVGHAWHCVSRKTPLLMSSIQLLLLIVHCICTSNSPPPERRFRGRIVRCAPGHFGPVFPDGKGDRGNYGVPIHGTAQILTQSKTRIVS